MKCVKRPRPARRMDWSGDLWSIGATWQQINERTFLKPEMTVNGRPELSRF